MARRYEYVIHGPPLSPSDSAQSPTSRKTLHSRRDSQKVSNLRSLYRNSASPTQLAEPLEPVQARRISSPTTPNLPPTPPVGDEKDEEDEAQTLSTEIENVTSESVPAAPVTPVNQHSPPTPEHTPPRNTLKAPLYPSLALRPSMASTRAESFKTANEHPYSDDELAQSEHDFQPALSPTEPIFRPSRVRDRSRERKLLPKVVEASSTQENVDNINPAFIPLPKELEDELDYQVGTDTPETQFRFEHLKDDVPILSEEPASIEADGPRESLSRTERMPSVYDQVTAPAVQEPLTRGKSLRDRLHESRQIPFSASMEAFADVIGWNDGNMERSPPESESRSNRWSGNSNPSAVEAYVVESPITPRKRGTLRKVVKNDSLRAVSSPIPHSKRESLQSNSDSSHRLVHKKARLTNQNRWSTGSDISRRSLSLNSAQALPKSEVIKVAVIPERKSSVPTSEGSSRRHSRSTSTGPSQVRSSMPPVTNLVPRRKRAFSDSTERTPSNDRPPSVPVRRSSLSAPTSRSASRANSISSEQFSLQRQQAEKDLRTTLDRMESERLSASLRRGSNQSSSPTPAPKSGEPSPEDNSLKPDDVHLSKRNPSTAGSSRSGPRGSAAGVNGVLPGTNEWAELRPPTMTGTPFSQASIMSASPEIIEAKVVSFFPHHNESLQLIEPNRISESQAVRALNNRALGRSNTDPSVKITTPRTSDHLAQNDNVDSPLRNPRKPPEPPRFAAISAAPVNELDRQPDIPADRTQLQSRGSTIVKRRPSLQGHDRSESFLKQLTRNFSTRNAKNMKADQELDSTSHPFWRPRAFWDDEDHAQRVRLDQTKPPHDGQTGVTNTTDPEVVRTVTILERPMFRSNTITTGPVSLIRRISERKRQRKVVDEHIAQQQALVKQNSYSSLQRFKAGRRLYGMPPLRSMSLNAGMGRLRNLQDRMVSARMRREDDKRERRREALRKSIGTEVVSQGDSRFVIDRSLTRKGDAMNEMLETARQQRATEEAQARI